MAEKKKRLISQQNVYLSQRSSEFVCAMVIRWFCYDGYKLEKSFFFIT